MTQVTSGKARIQNHAIASLFSQLRCVILPSPTEGMLKIIHLGGANQILELLVMFILYLRRRQWHPTPVLLPGKSHGWRSLVGCGPWGR